MIRGLLEPDLVLIGQSDKRTSDLLEALYRKYNTNLQHIARMSITSTKFTNISVNRHITTRINFTNQLRMIAEQYADTDIHMILDAIGPVHALEGNIFKPV